MVPLALAAGIGGAGAISNLASGIFGSGAARKAGREQAAAIQQGVDFQKQVYGDAGRNMNPYIQSGQQALGTYGGMLANAEQPQFGYQQQAFDFNKYQDPGARYAADESARQLNAQSIARGATGGGALKALQVNQNNLNAQNYQNAYGRFMDTSKMAYGQAVDQYGRDYAYQNNMMDRYGNLAGQGLYAANSLMGGGNAAAANIGGLYSNMGGAQAAGTLGGSNAMWTGIGGAINSIGSGLGAFYGYGDKPGISSNIKGYGKNLGMANNGYGAY